MLHKFIFLQNIMLKLMIIPRSIRIECRLTGFVRD